MTKPPSAIEDLEARHKAIYDEFRPTVQSYTRMASELLNVQLGLFRAKLEQTWPDAKYSERPVIARLSARLSPGEFHKSLQALATLKVEVTEVSYDEVKHDFILFGKLPS